MKTKHKIRGGKPFELYSDLQFEECLYRLEHDTGNLKVDLRRNSDEQARFMILFPGAAEKAASVSGTLQPWGDSATRIEGMVISRPDTSPRAWINILFYLLLIVLLAAFISAQVQDSGSRDIAAFFSWVSVMLIGLMVALISMFLNAYFRSRALMRHLENLLTDKRKKTKG
jgi:hypothetical protein